MNYDPSENFNDTSGGKTNGGGDTDTTQDASTDTLKDKNAPDELSQPGVGVQYEDEPVGDSD